MRELVHFDQGRVTWSMAVAKVADALNPFGTARDVVATLGACVIEVKQIDLERQRVQRLGQAFDSALLQRQYEVEQVFQDRFRMSGMMNVNLSAVRETLTIVVRNSSDQYIPGDERQIHAGLIPVLTGQLVQANQDLISWTASLDTVLYLRPQILSIKAWGN